MDQHAGPADRRLAKPLPGSAQQTLILAGNIQPFNKAADRGEWLVKGGDHDIGSSVKAGQVLAPSMPRS